MKKKIFLMSMVALILILLMMPNVKAAFQSKFTSIKGSNLTKKPIEWFRGIRNMESAGQGMGLNETFDNNTLLSTSGSNSIDVHLQKNTEYGAMVLLGASDYGKQGSGTTRYMTNGASDNSSESSLAGNLKTSTGNKSGVYNLGGDYREEVTAAGLEVFFNSVNSSIDSKYKNVYTTPIIDSAKRGDAIFNPRNWQGDGPTNWGWGSAYGYGMERGFYSAFSYDPSQSNASHYARAAVVCGTGV